MASTSWHLQNNNNLATKFPQYIHLWHPVKNGTLTPDEVTPYSPQKVWLLFLCGHECQRHVFNLVKGYGCPYCAKSSPKLLKGFNDLKTKNPKAALKWHPTLNGDLTSEMVTEFSGRRVHWLCECGEPYKVSVAEVSQGHYKGCKSCSVKNRVATTIQKYGVPINMQNPAIKQKHAQTNISRYGFANAMSNPTVSARSMRSAKKTTLLRHWKDNKELVCNASYELKVVSRWNEEKEEFMWQIPIRIPAEVPYIGGCLYWVDAYLPERDLYIEIKGFFKGKKFDGIPVSKLKWDWFHAAYPNSELWDKAKLKSLNIL